MGPLKDAVNAVLADTKQQLNGLLYMISALNELTDLIKEMIIELCRPTVHSLYLTNFDDNTSMFFPHFSNL